MHLLKKFITASSTLHNACSVAWKLTAANTVNICLASRAAFAGCAELLVATTTSSAVNQPAHVCLMNINTVNIYSKEGSHDIWVPPATLNKYCYPTYEVVPFLIAHRVPQGQPQVAASHTHHLDQAGTSPSLKATGLCKCLTVLQLVNSVEKKCKLAEAWSTALDPKRIASYWLDHLMMGISNCLYQLQQIKPTLTEC